eukprot:jgi/Mesvir1/24565/Mv21898-RA.1
MPSLERNICKGNKYLACRQVLEHIFPGTPVVESNPAPPLRKAIAQGVSFVQMAGLGFVMAGDKILTALGVPNIAAPRHPAWALYDRFSSNRLPWLATWWILGNSVHGQLLSTGAFEVYYDGHLLFSKLETGHVPEVETLVNLVAAAMKERDAREDETAPLLDADEL